MTNESLNLPKMDQLSKTESAIFLLGGVLMVIGSGASVLARPWAPYLFSMGALAFSLMQFKQKYRGGSFVVRRLRRIMLLSDVLFLLTAVLMFADSLNLFRLDYLSYVQYVHNNWVLTLLVAAVLQLYATHRMGRELDREAKKS